jgi:hypothetical protein
MRLITASIIWGAEFGSERRGWPAIYTMTGLLQSPTRINFPGFRGPTTRHASPYPFQRYLLRAGRTGKLSVAAPPAFAPGYGMAGIPRRYRHR